MLCMLSRLLALVKSNVNMIIARCSKQSACRLLTKNSVNKYTCNHPSASGTIFGAQRRHSLNHMSSTVECKGCHQPHLPVMHHIVSRFVIVSLNHMASSATLQRHYMSNHTCFAVHNSGLTNSYLAWICSQSAFRLV